MAWLKLRTMSLWESGDSSGDISLAGLFKSDTLIDGQNDIGLDRLAFLACRGGWPKAVLSKRHGAALTQAEEYFEAVVRFDISRADGVGRDEEIARRLMRSYARNQGSQATAGTILEDIQASGGAPINENTVYSYIKALKKIFVIDL